MEKKPKTVRELREALKDIRKRPISSELVEKHNRIIEKDDEYERVERKKDHPRKIARNPEADL